MAQLFCHRLHLVRAASAISLLFWVQPLAQANQSVVFSIENNTSLPLVGFYTTPVTVEDWGNDRLSGNPLASGSSIDITLNDVPNDCLYDVIGIFEGGEYVEEYAVDLCTLSGGKYAFFDEDDRSFRIENRTSSPISGFYFTANSQGDWGDNLFEGSGYALPPGETVDILIDSSDCAYDFRAMFTDGRTAEEFGIDVCGSDPAVTFVEE